jgi:hypothetical protein
VPEQPSYLPIVLSKSDQHDPSKKHKCFSSSLCWLVDEVMEESFAIKDAFIDDLETLDLGPFFKNSL